MPTKSIWTTNPKKYLPPTSNELKHKEKITPLPRLPPTSRNKVNSTLQRPRPSTPKKKLVKVPVSLSAELVRDQSSIFLGKSRPVQLPTFGSQRDQLSPLGHASAMSWSRPAICVPKRTEPTIRKIRRRGAEELTIAATRCYQPPETNHLTDMIRLRNFNSKQTDVSSSVLSQNILFDHLTLSSKRLEHLSSFSFTSSASSSFSDENDRPSSIGPDADEHQERRLKDVLEIRSIGSILDSQTCVSKGQTTAPIVENDQRAIFLFEAMKNDSGQTQTSLQKSNRSSSIDDALRPLPTTIKNRGRQTSDLVEQKPDKYVSIHRLSSLELEKAGFVRIDPCTYRLSVDKSEKFQNHRQRSDDLFDQYENNCNEPENFHEESLPPAHDEESYAALPRTSSTEQLNNYLQKDLRVLVNQFIRPMKDSITKHRLSRTQTQRFKRMQTVNEQNPLRIEDITDKLLSSIDCSTYVQFQRCC